MTIQKEHNETPVSGLHKYFYTIRDNYYQALDVIWSKIPNFLGTLIATIIIFIAGSTMRGDWLLILVHFIRSFRDAYRDNTTDYSAPPTFNISDFSLEQLRLQGLPFFMLMNLTVSFTIYFGICGFLQWYFYIRQHHQPETWKCQPKKFLEPDVERHEIIWGSINVALGALVFGTIACYTNNGGYTTLYFRPGERGWIYLISSSILMWFYADASAYYGHRFFHCPFLYRTFHKWHHYYKQPTAFSATSFHPLEFIFYQSLLLLPSFIMPLHVVGYVGVLLYVYYYGLIDHSGIKMDGLWPWQPDTTFHDNHHQYFNINFGFNLVFWDKLHGTYKYVDNSMVGKKSTEQPSEFFRTDEETIRLEKEYMKVESMKKSN